MGTESVCKASLDVKVPEFTTEFQSAEANLGEAHTFSLEMEFESVNVTWHKGDDELTDSSKYKITKEGRWHRLEIQNVELFDEGEYFARIAQSNKFIKGINDLFPQDIHQCF